MATTIIDDIISDNDGFNIFDGDDYFFTSGSFIQATGTNDEAITVANGETVKSVVTVAGDVIGNRVGVELDGNDILFVTTGAVVRDERAFGIRTVGSNNQVVVAGFVAGNDSGVELDGDGDRLTITETGVVAGSSDPDQTFRPAAVNLRGEDTVLEVAGTIFAGDAAGGGNPAITNVVSRFDQNADLDATVINSGSIFGDVKLNAGNDTYDARGGGFVSGVIDLGSDEDLFHGGALAETADGGDGEDRMFGGNGDDTLDGGAGNDRVYGGEGDDTLDGSSGDDLLRGGTGHDTINGGGDADTLAGGRGEDVLSGGDGRDILIGGRGDDDLTGGRSGDTFIFKGAFGHDVITDFRDSNLEKIDLSGVNAITGLGDLVNNHLEQRGNDAMISAGGNTITLSDFTAADLDAGDFIF